MKKLPKEKIENLEKARNEFILKAETKQKKDEWKNIILRIRVDACNQVDELASKRMGIKRTAWILEAIQEKIKRDSNE